MVLRRGTGLVVAASVALVAIWGCTPRSLEGQQLPPATAPADKAARASTKRGSEWTVELRPNANVVIAHHGVPVATCATRFWGRNWHYAQTAIKRVSAEEGHQQFAGEIRDLKLSVRSDVLSPAPNVIRTDLTVRAGEDMTGVIGGGWQWDFKLDSPAVGGRAPAPELLPDNRGWTWRVGDGQVITLQFAEPPAKVYYEGAHKSAIRTFWYADRITAGPRRLVATLELPDGSRWKPSPEERYAPLETGQWFRAALAPGAAPVDLSFLNRDDRPAGRRGLVRADGDRLVFGDGTPARFWGGNIAANALFEKTRKEPTRRAHREEIARQAHRMSQLGYNLMRIHHHDSDWVGPNIFGRHPNTTTRRLDPASLDDLDWLIKCLEDEGIYVWLDMHVGRLLLPADGLTEGADEVKRAKGAIKSFCYYNGQLQALMKEMQHGYLDHENRYNRLRYKDDPGVVVVLITNENDLTYHGGNGLLPDKNNPYHNKLWTGGYQQFARRYNLPPARVFQTWLPGPSKLYLAQAEHEFNQTMIADLRQIGVKSLIATTDFWGDEPLYSLASLADGGLIDVHTYGTSEEFSKNAHYQGTFAHWIAAGQVYGKPLSITEWNVPLPQADRFTAPLYVASLAALQGWDAPMIYNYSQIDFRPNPGPEAWSTYHEPALTAIMPAAALLFRRGHVSPARKTYCFLPGADAMFNRDLTPQTSATIRTLAEQSKLTIGMPEVHELPWLKPAQPSADVIRITDPDHDFIPEGQSFVRSDTGELMRDWEQGIQTIDSPRTQAVSGWIGGKMLRTKDATFEVKTPKAVVALSSVDDRPLSESQMVMVSAVARAVASPGNKWPYLSEPVYARIALRTKVDDLELLSMAADGRVASRPHVERRDGTLTFEIPAAGGTHWYILKSRGGVATPARGAAADSSTRAKS